MKISKILLGAMWLMIILMWLSVIVKATEKDEEFNYLAKCVQAEAGNQDLMGKRLVAAVILNRVEDDRFPDSIEEVIKAPKQFSVVHNKTIDKVIVDQETVEACRLELIDRINKDIIYFNNSPKVSGTFCCKHGEHWFGK